MRALIAPDSFGDTLTAVQAAEAIATGWARARPDDELVCAPLSDGGPGFVDVLATRLGRLITTTVPGPLGDPVDARWLIDDTGDAVTAYIECAQACGLHLVGPRSPRTAFAASTRGVGDLICAAVAAGASRIIVGLGGSASTDGGAGLVDALAGPGVSDPRTAVDRLAGVELVAASDVDNPLLGPAGAAAVFGPQKGADPDMVAVLEDRMTVWNDTLTALAGGDIAGEAGAGAAGGLGAALIALGARRVSGAAVIATAIGLGDLVVHADLLITGEGKFDHQTLQGKVVSAVATAARGDLPTVVFAGQVILTEAELVGAGIAQAHAIVDIADSVAHAMDDAGPLLARLAEQVGLAWKRE
ncbi:glycerate kinase family protein [Williamsia phyllosphaerae]|uniref:Glycerate kinase n=1 Tax=Williamsia phyllosphaerae TaxID=885042 RepID=A0ABQ1UX66_9NOCA|nr:glycerate kinase [Williamsia phyllosphaerae]GGF29136.1 putative glycerate kinase [Williamsia phyllosphaerae]